MKIVEGGRFYAISDDGTIVKQGVLYATNIHRKDHVPHWQTYGDGTADLRVECCAAKDKTWMTLDAQEHGEKSSKRTMLHLNREQIERLRDMCNIALQDRTRQALETLVGAAVSQSAWWDDEGLERHLATGRSSAEIFGDVLEEAREALKAAS